MSLPRYATCIPRRRSLVLGIHTDKLRRPALVGDFVAEEQVGRERVEGGASGRRLVARLPPEIHGEALAEGIQHGGDEWGGEGKDGVASEGDDKDVGPVRQAVSGERDAEPGAQGPEDEAVEEIDGEDVREDEHEGLKGEEFLDQWGHVNGCLQASGEDESVQPRDEVLRSCGGPPGFRDCKATAGIRMDAILIGCIIDSRPLSKEVHGRSRNGKTDAQKEQGVVDARPRVEIRPPLIRDVQIGEHDAHVKIAPPRQSVPVIDETKSIEAEPLPRRFDLLDHNDGK